MNAYILLHYKEKYCYTCRKCIETEASWIHITHSVTWIYSQFLVYFIVEAFSVIRFIDVRSM